MNPCQAPDKHSTMNTSWPILSSLAYIAQSLHAYSSSPYPSIRQEQRECEISIASGQKNVPFFRWMWLFFGKPINDLIFIFGHNLHIISFLNFSDIQKEIDQENLTPVLGQVNMTNLTCNLSITSQFASEGGRYMYICFLDLGTILAHFSHLISIIQHISNNSIVPIIP